MEKICFYNEDDGYEMDEEDREVQDKAFRRDKLFGGNQWVLDFRDDNMFWVNTKGSEIMRNNN
jgi:hypothetical protein